MIDKTYELQVIDAIKQSASATIPLIIKDLIAEHTIEKNHIETSWTEYKGDVPILHQPQLSNKNAPDNRPTHDYRGLIVSEKVGYLTGIPIQVFYPEDEAGNDLIQNFLKVNSYESMDSNTMTYLAATGKAYRLLYLSKNYNTGKVEVQMSNQLPWECIVITDPTLDNLPVYGLIYYQVEVKNAKVKKWRTRVEFYDETKVYYFIENESGNYIPDITVDTHEEPHGFTIMPLVEFNNNLLKMSDFEKVRTLIDSYDSAMSFALNDNESFSNALMIFKDVPLTQALIDQARYLRGIEINSSATKPTPDVSYLTKDIKIENTDQLLGITKENIFKFSSAVDIFSEAFSGGNISGESRKQQLIPLELKCKETERLFQYSLRNMFNVIATYWSMVTTVEVKPEEIDFIFTRSIIPTEYTLDQIIKMFEVGLISHETALSLVSFIDNPETEVAKIKTIQPTIQE